MNTAIEGTRYVGEYRLVSVSDYITGDWDSDAWKCDDPEYWEPYRDGGQVRMYEQSLTVKGDLNLDLSESTLGCVGIVVQGNLTVEGNIVNYGNGGVSLCVEGYTEARNLLASDAYINLYKADIEYITIGYYNDGYTWIGTLKTQLMLNDQHHLSVGNENKIEVSVGCEMRTGGKVEVDIQELMDFWGKNEILTNTGIVEKNEQEDEYADPRDDSYYFNFIKFANMALNGEEEILINYVDQYVSEYKDRCKDLQLPLDLHDSIRVKWENNVATTVYIDGKKGLEEFSWAIRTTPPKSLHTLVLAGMELNDVAESVERLTQIHTLVLLDNDLETVPTWLKSFNHLKKLVINENEITEIPDWIDGLTQLVELNVSGNAINTIPGSIGKLKLLKKLDLSYNYLTSIPTTIDNLRKLTFLDLFDNEFSKPIISLKKLQDAGVKVRL